MCQSACLYIFTRTSYISYFICYSKCIGHKNNTLSSFTEVWKRHRGGFVFRHHIKWTRNLLYSEMCHVSVLDQCCTPVVMQFMSSHLEVMSRCIVGRGYFAMLYCFSVCVRWYKCRINIFPWITASLFAIILICYCIIWTYYPGVMH